MDGDIRGQLRETASSEFFAQRVASDLICASGATRNRLSEGGGGAFSQALPVAGRGHEGYTPSFVAPACDFFLLLQGPASQARRPEHC